MKIIDANTRLRERGGPKVLIVGPSGVGKTSLLRTLSTELLASTLFVDIEAGDLAVADVPVASVQPRTWGDCRDTAVVVGGFNPALPATAYYSEAHYHSVMQNSELARLSTFNTLFVDSLTAASRLCFTWAEQQPEPVTNRGYKDLRSIYGIHGRAMIGWLNQLQHIRNSTVVFVAVLEKHVDDRNIATWQPQIEGANGSSNEMLSFRFPAAATALSSEGIIGHASILRTPQITEGRLPGIDSCLGERQQPFCLHGEIAPEFTDRFDRIAIGGRRCPNPPRLERLVVNRLIRPRGGIYLQ